MFWIVIYIILIGLAIWVGNGKGNSSIFRTSSKVGWVASGISLLMIRLSVDQGQMLTGIVSKHGMSGIWLVFGGMFGAFVIPIVFAPLWHRLNLENDNDFYLIRYPGQAGKTLMTFRTFYVGLLVASLMLAFHIMGFSRIIVYFFGCSEAKSIFYSGGILIVYALKNTMDIKIKTDAIHGCFYLFALGMIVYSVIVSPFGELHSLNNSFDKSMFPPSSDSWSYFSVMVFLGVQWWSSNLFDGGGPEMSRFTAVKSEAAAVRSGVLSVLFGIGLSTLMLLIVMVLLSSLSTLFAYSIGTLEGLIKLTFSISAGVAPVYILRWFWFRISAGSQIGAMLSSAIFTLSYSYLHSYLPLYDYPLEEARIVFVTIGTTIVWIAITLFIPSKAAKVNLNMRPVVGSVKQLWSRMIIAILMGVILFEFFLILVGLAVINI